MTFDEFKADFLAFLESSTVNLGRRTTKTRQAFLDTASAKFDAFVAGDVAETPEQPVADNMSDRVLCVKPTDRNRALDIGKGVHAMTPSESMRADEQLNRSPYGDRKKGQENE